MKRSRDIVFCLMFFALILVILFSSLQKMKTMHITMFGVELTSETTIGPYAIYVDSDGDLVAFNNKTDTFSVIAYEDFDATVVRMEEHDENSTRLRNEQ